MAILTVVGGDNRKRLYLAFGEYKRSGDVFYCIQATNLRECISEVGVCSGKELPVHMGCAKYGRKIIFVGGVESIYDGIEKWDFAPHPTKDVYAFNTDAQVKPKPNAQVMPKHNIISMPSLFHYSCLRGGKFDPIIREHDGKLFVLSSYPMRFAGVPQVPAFEVFDSKEGEWKSLPYPPPFELLYNQRSLHTLFSYLILGSNIFVSSGFSSSIFRFNLAEPDNGWQPHAFVDYHRLPLYFTPRSVGVECDGGDWVILDYDASSPNLTVYLISKDLRTLKPLAPLRLPYQFSPSDYYNEDDIRFCNIFHIEGRKVGLVVAVDENGQKYRLVEDKRWPTCTKDPDSDSESHDLDGVGLVEKCGKGESLYRPILIHVVTFEFELEREKNAIAFTDLDPLQIFSYDAGDRPNESTGNTEVELLEALWL